MVSSPRGLALHRNGAFRSTATAGSSPSCVQLTRWPIRTRPAIRDYIARAHRAAERCATYFDENHRQHPHRHAATGSRWPSGCSGRRVRRFSRGRGNNTAAPRPCRCGNPFRRTIPTRASWRIARVCRAAGKAALTEGGDPVLRRRSTFFFENEYTCPGGASDYRALRRCRPGAPITRSGALFNDAARWRRRRRSIKRGLFGFARIRSEMEAIVPRGEVSTQLRRVSVRSYDDPQF